MFHSKLNEILKRCQYISKPLSFNSDRSEQYVGYITDIYT